MAFAFIRDHEGAWPVRASRCGSQYASARYQSLLGKHGIECGMSGVAQRWDNAPAESFFATLKKELAHHEEYATQAQARASIFECVEVFYDRRRLHSSLGYVTPAAHEDDPDNR